MVLPALQEDVERPMPAPLLLPQYPPHLVKHLRQEHFLCITNLQHPHSHSMPKMLTVVFPIVDGLSQVFIVPSLYQLSEFGY